MICFLLLLMLPSTSWVHYNTLRNKVQLAIETIIIQRTDRFIPLFRWHGIYIAITCKNVIQMEWIWLISSNIMNTLGINHLQAYSLMIEKKKILKFLLWRISCQVRLLFHWQLNTSLRRYKYVYSKTYCDRCNWAAKAQDLSILPWRIYFVHDRISNDHFLHYAK